MKKLAMVALFGAAFVIGWLFGIILRLLPIHTLIKGVLAIVYCTLCFIAGKKLGVWYVKES